MSDQEHLHGLGNPNCGGMIHINEKRSTWKGQVCAAAMLALLSIFAASTLAGCDLRSPGSNALGETTLPAPSWIEVYFTNPEAIGARSYKGGPDEYLEAAIRNAQYSVDVAVHNLNLWSIEGALLDAHRRGVVVRMVTESDNMESSLEIQELKAEGIPVIGDRREGRMHNKFVVIDGQEVWTGSMNFSTTDAYHNHNNMLRVRSTQLAKDYSAEFEEMFVDDQFGPGSPAATPYHQIQINNTPIEVLFSPEDSVLERLVQIIQTAESSVYFMVYSFTLDPLAEALLARAQAGVQVAGLFDEDQYKSNQKGEFDRLRAARLDVRLDGSPGKMHHKVLIIDQKIVVTGSYNFSASAEEYNDENTLVIYSAQVAELFLREFHLLMKQAQ